MWLSESDGDKPNQTSKKIAQQVGYSASWWPGAESTRTQDI